MKVASLKYCEQLYKLSGWREHAKFGTCDPVIRYGLGFLFEKAIAHHSSIRFKHVDEQIVLTASPCYHIEASSAEDALAKLLISDLKAGRL